MIPWWTLIIVAVVFLVIGFAIACILASRSRDDRIEDELLYNAVNKKENDDN